MKRNGCCAVLCNHRYSGLCYTITHTSCTHPLRTISWWQQVWYLCVVWQQMLWQLVCYLCAVWQQVSCECGSRFYICVLCGSKCHVQMAAGLLFVLHDSKFDICALPDSVKLCGNRFNTCVLCSSKCHMHVAAGFIFVCCVAANVISVLCGSRFDMDALCYSCCTRPSRTSSVWQQAYCVSWLLTRKVQRWLNKRVPQLLSPSCCTPAMKALVRTD